MRSMAPGERTKHLGVRLTPEEARVVSEVSEETGLSVSDVVRQAVRQAYAERFRAAKAKALKKTKR